MKLVFRPKTKSYKDILITARARRIWTEQQGSVVHALTQTSGLVFTQDTIRATSGVFEGIHSGTPGIVAMSLPLNVLYEDSPEPHYQRDIEYIGAVTHELAHHLLLEHRIVAPQGPRHDTEAHQHIYVFLLDAWQLAYGGRQAKELIQYEVNSAVPNNYAAALKWARQLSKTKRQELTTYLVKNKCLPSGVAIIRKL